MAIPLIPIAISSVAGTIAGGLIFGKSDQQEQELASYEYSPTDVYAPTITDARQDARTMVYQPSIIIDSPEARTSQYARTDTRQRQDIEPRQEIAPVVERTITQGATGSADGIPNETIFLIGGLVVAGLFLLKK